MPRRGKNRKSETNSAVESAETDSDDAISNAGDTLSVGVAPSIYLGGTIATGTGRRAPGSPVPSTSNAASGSQNSALSAVSNFVSESSSDSDTDVQDITPDAVSNDASAADALITQQEQNVLSASAAAASGSSKSENQESYPDKGLIATIVDLIECPVCGQPPRPQEKIYGCKNGHIVCAACLKRVTGPCPVCRQTGLDSRQVILERIAEEALKSHQFRCRWATAADACKERYSIEEIAQHESTCVRRMVGCPGQHRRHCQWIGPLYQLYRHALVNKCVQVLKKTSKGTYRNYLGQGPFFGTREGVFGQASFVQWKPAVLVNPGMLRAFSYLMVYRKPTGQWVILCRALGSLEEVQKLRIEVKVRRGRPGDLEDEWMKRTGDIPEEEEKEEVEKAIICSVVPFSMKEETVLNAGNALVMKDPEVKALASEDSLFRYEVRLWTASNPLPSTSQQS